MEFSLFLFGLCVLVTFSECFKHKLGPEEFGVPPNEAEEFFRVLLSKFEADSRYDPDSSGPFDYDEKLYSDYDSFGDTESSRNLMPTTFDFPASKPSSEKFMHPFRQAVEEYFREQMITQSPTKENEELNPSTTAASDGLASIPPASPEKGQKEYAMLRPPIDNHNKIEHWMKIMDENSLDLKGYQKKRKTVQDPVVIKKSITKSEFSGVESQLKVP